MGYKKTGTGTVGTTYDSSNGGFQKAEYLIPPCYWYAEQLANIILASQDKAFTEIEILCGIVLPPFNTTYFSPDNVIAGIRKISPDGNSISIQARDEGKRGQNYANAKFYLDVYVVAGKSYQDKKFTSAFLQGIENILYSLNPQQLVDGWPAHITDPDPDVAQALRANYAPTITKDESAVIDKNPDGNRGYMKTLGAVGCFTCTYTAKFKPNTLPYPLI